MKTIIYSFFLFSLILSCASRKPEEKIATKELLVEAYTFGFPLVLMDLKREAETNVSGPDPQSGRAPINQFVHHRLNPENKLHLSTAWLDLSDEALVLELPDTHGRFYFLPMLDAWTNVFMTPGKRTGGTGARKYVIVGPDWEDDIPVGTEFIRSRTNMMWIVGRTQGNGKDSLDDVKTIQEGFKLYPLSYLGRAYTPPAGISNPNQDMQPAVDRIFTLTGEEFFTRLNRLMKNNPTSGEDYLLMKRLASIGIAPGKGFSTKKFDEKEKAFITRLPVYMQEKLDEERKELLESKVGWFTLRGMGAYGTDYAKRAVIAYMGLGRNLDEDGIYPYVRTDIEGRPLDHNKKYVLHFEPDEIPQVNAFFGLAVYRESNYLVSSQAPHAFIGGLEDVKLNPDRSLDIYIQQESPGKNKEANWLEVPPEPFVVEARLFWPKIETITESWTLPPVFEAGSKVQLSDNQLED